MNRIQQLEKIREKDSKLVTIITALDFIMSILSDNGGNAIINVTPGKGGWFNISTTDTLKDADYQNIISENELLRTLINDIDALNIEIVDKGYTYKCNAKCPITSSVLTKEKHLDSGESKTSITFRIGYDKSDIDEKELCKCLKKIFCEKYHNLHILVFGQGVYNNFIKL